MPTFTPLGVGLGLLAAVVAAAALWPRAGPTVGADDPAGARAEATTAAATAGSAATTASPGDPAVASTLGPVVVDALTLAVMDAAPSPLHRELAAALGASLVPAPPQRPTAEALSTAPSGPGAGPEAFAVVRYDTLRALRDRAPAGSLRIVAPLFREPVHVFVPAASPLRSVADLRGHRLNVGPRTPGDTTVGTLYARLFDHPLTAAQLDRTDGPAAMATLGTPSGADALVRVGVLPLPGLDPLPAGWRRLPLDGRGGMDRRARRSYLPADVAGVPTVSVMAFLVAGPHATDAQIAEAVRRLCARLPALRQAGHPAWQDVQPQAAFDTGWPEARAAQAARAACTAPIHTVPFTATRAPPDPARPSGTRPAVPPTRSLEPSP